MAPLKNLIATGALLLSASALSAPALATLSLTTLSLASLAGCGSDPAPELGPEDDIDGDGFGRTDPLN